MWLIFDNLGVFNKNNFLCKNIQPIILFELLFVINIMNTLGNIPLKFNSSFIYVIYAEHNNILPQNHAIIWNQVFNKKNQT